MKLLRFFPALTVLAVGVMSATSSRAITRDEVMVQARAHAYHPWRCTAANTTASCSASYQSLYTPGDYIGLPYDWGGHISLFEFDQEIAAGAGAGSGISQLLDCTVGLDCSGYVTKCWESGHYGTSTLQGISSLIDQSELLPGDVFNQPNYHVILFSHELANGDPILYEALPPNVHINPWGGWAYTSNYDPRRYDGITGTTAGTPVGTPDNPIPISSLPYTDSRDTNDSSSDVIDGCGESPGTDESGPEYVYEVTFTEPGQLTVSVSDDVGVDIDVHLFTSMNTNDCVARHDSTFTEPVDCGTYYIVADTFGSGLGNAGTYTLNVTFTPSGGACGSGPPPYNPGGAAGEDCDPICNPNLGGEACLISSDTPPVEFCSHSCTGDSDCPEFPGGCCRDIGSGEFYCLTDAFCGGTTPDAGADASPADASPTDASQTDASPLPDGSTQDATPSPDGTAPQDSSTATDAGTDGSDSIVVEGGLLPASSDEDDGGCGCRTRQPRDSAPGALLTLACALLLLRRRK